MELVCFNYCSGWFVVCFLYLFVVYLWVVFFWVEGLLIRKSLIIFTVICLHFILSQPRDYTAANCFWHFSTTTTKINWSRVWEGKLMCTDFITILKVMRLFCQKYKIITYNKNFGGVISTSSSLIKRSQVWASWRQIHVQCRTFWCEHKFSHQALMWKSNTKWKNKCIREEDQRRKMENLANKYLNN